ncbi:hypothetical protein L6452_32378 [Arctium lappa]|uniref:Uncharacterized protein n=1 Tax=Arctium lappa TaxID=4217 RepID=A0ACB8Z5B0_ARCLA|nr:hypothetical protein L6452_32378 [Arctium lappa]
METSKLHQQLPQWTAQVSLSLLRRLPPSCLLHSCLAFISLSFVYKEPAARGCCSCPSLSIIMSAMEMKETALIWARQHCVHLLLLFFK